MASTGNITDSEKDIQASLRNTAGIPEAFLLRGFRHTDGSNTFTSMTCASRIYTLDNLLGPAFEDGHFTLDHGPTALMTAANAVALPEALSGLRKTG
jgi:hypothetical protein